MRIIADDVPTDRDESITSSDFDVSFQHALCGINDSEFDSDLLAFLTAYLRSDLAKYYLFHTSSSWGIARPVVKVQELLRLPMPFPGEQQEPKHCREIVKSVSKIIKDTANKAKGSFMDRSAIVDSATALDAHENPITKDLCRRMIQNKKSSEFPFRIHYQSVELEPVDGTDQGDMDIAFFPSQISQEDIYFCLECKRLHVTKNGKFSSLATEYVTEGMLRFINGRYSAMVNNGGMLGYVLNGDTDQAINNVSNAVQALHILFHHKRGHQLLI